MTNKVDKMLALIQQRLKAYSLEETIERLHSYDCDGPTVSELYLSFERQLEECFEYTICNAQYPQIDKFSYQSANDELFSSDDCLDYGLAA